MSNDLKNQKSSGKINLDKFIEKLYKGEILLESEINDICKYATEILSKEKNVVSVSTPITICGDIHGQFSDLLELFKIGGYLPETSYLFLGDYVDRGFKSVETISLLLCYKIRYPTRLFLTRGNHECRKVTQVYGFYDECIKKYGSLDIWKKFTAVFDLLPLTAMIDGRIFCLHGGLSPEIKTIEELRKIDRNIEVPDNGVISDLLWSDPDEKSGWSVSPRGAGSLFGPDITRKFNHINKLELILRAHQLVMEGYNMVHENDVCTLFSAPNYCYRCGNKASILELDENFNKHIQQFDPSPDSQTEENTISTRTPNYFL